MIIAQISDTHIAYDSDDASQRICDFEAVVADINALDPAPDVIVHTGDIVHNGRADEYERATAILEAARAPVYVMAGNKDDRANLRNAFAEQGYLSSDSAFIDYAVDGFPVRLVMLDTLDSGSNKGDFCAARLRRLPGLVGADTGRPVAVFTHHPPFEVLVGPERVHFRSVEAMKALAFALQSSGLVTALVSGHVHRSTFGSVGGIPASVATAVATTLRKGEIPPGMKSRPVYQVHRFDTSGGFATETRIARTGPSGL